MGKYDNEADAAAEATDIELKNEINELIKANPESLFPEKADQDVVNELIAECEKSTSRNETITACQAIALKLSVEGKKIFQDTFQIAKRMAF